MALCKNIQSKCSSENGQYIHYGPTAQDIIDTAQAMRVKEAYKIILKDLKTIRKNLIKVAKKHRETVMAGRTHVEHAVPITVGFKVSVWINEFDRHIARMEEIAPRLLVGNITGAVGTFAGFGTKRAFQLQKLALKRLGLKAPLICWHAARDRFAEFLNLLAIIASTCAKVANEIRTLLRIEIGEFGEPVSASKIGSSTMPQKKNPTRCEETIALAKLIRRNGLAMMEAMEVEHERDGSVWRVEYVAIPESCLLTGTLLRNLKEISGGLLVYPENMRRNIELSKGLIMSETLMFALASKIGKQSAHQLIWECVKRTMENKLDFRKVVRGNKIIKKHLTDKEIDNCFNYEKHTGLSKEIVDRVLNKKRR